MANDHLQFSTAFPLKTDAEKKWCIQTVTALANLIVLEPSEDRNQIANELGKLGQRVLAEDWAYLDFEWSVDRVSAGGVEMWIYAEESGDPDQVAAFLQAYLQKFNPQGSLWFSWAYTCSKMRVNEFGGGAAVVTADAIRVIDAQHWAQEGAEKVPGSRHLENPADT